MRKILTVEIDKHGQARVDGYLVDDDEISQYRSMGCRFQFTKACWLVSDQQVRSIRRKFGE
jgi:hypothetical protein